MAVPATSLLAQLKDPRKEVNLVRRGLKVSAIEDFLNKNNFIIKDVLERLDISASTYFAKKKKQAALDAYTSEKFIRLIQVTIKATNVLGDAEGKNWLFRPIPSLGNEIPINLLDTEAGHRLVEQALLQIEHSVYG